MKKTLVALAALASVSAFAQSSVVIDGYFDRGYVSTNSTNNAADVKTVGSAAGTTTVGIKVREDLGNGLSVGGSVNTDWSDLGGATQVNTIANAQTTGFANSQSFVDLTSKTMGTLRLGAANNFTLTNATAVASPAFSTGVGSAYSASFSIANGLGTGTSGMGGTVTQQAGITETANVGARAIRIANTVQYSSPSFSGLSVHLGVTPQNNNVTTNAGAGNTVGVTETALRYTNGPVDAMYTTIKYTVGSNGTSQTKLTTASATTASPSLAENDITVQDNTQNLLGVAYQVMPALKLNVGLGTFSSSGNNFKGSSKSIGGTYTMGKVDILAQMAKVDDTSTTNKDRTLTGLGANYNFSKTARAYFRYEAINYGDNVAATAGSELKRYALGVSKSF
jgi:predicted porin